ncbi:hypothetical protein [Streptomyces viridochromogenes]|uniref:hypothetical protein n=1 Tax=Streptomyces viridochromogenes TaxID=1938 RepID=UPI00069CDA4A|nr:hypothetical protein [Streptomyces viridochromogenes]KOG21779.1 hypothetical protein ADK36_12425 [Streptomyces viridochromogenes]
MSTAELLVEAIHTFNAVADAFVQWLIFLATVAAVLALAVIACGAWGVRALWRRAAGPSWRRGHVRARIYAARRLRRSNGRTRPHWVHSQPLDYEEAA